jgi:hypothetical protein
MLQCFPFSGERLALMKLRDGCPLRDLSWSKAALGPKWYVMQES